jgi:hypothetical protein
LYNHRTIIVRSSLFSGRITTAHAMLVQCSYIITMIVRPSLNTLVNLAMIVQPSYYHRYFLKLAGLYPPKVPSLRYAKRFFGGPRYRFVTPPAGTPRHQANTPAGPADARAPPSRRHLSTSPLSKNFTLAINLAIVVRWLYDSCTIIVRRLYDHRTMVVRWLYDGCTMVVRWLLFYDARTTLVRSLQKR